MITRGIVLQPENSIDVEPGAVTLIDQSRYKNNGTMLGAGEPNAVQLPGGLWVWDFDGTNDVITIPYTPSMWGWTAFTIEVWANPDQIRNQRAIMNFTGVGLLQDVNISIYDSHWYMTLRIVPAGEVGATGVGTPQINTWYYLVIRWTGTHVTGFENGVPLAAPAALAGTLDEINKPMVLAQGGGLNLWDGLISPLCIRNYALTDGQILNNYEKTKHLFGVHD